MDEASPFTLPNCDLALFQIYIEWPWGGKGPNITYSQSLGEIVLTYEYLQLEPIGLIFVLFFAVVLFIQLIGMLIHRCPNKYRSR